MMPIHEATNASLRRAETGARRAALSVLVHAESDELNRAWERLAPQPACQTVRRPETGLVMVRGRMGGTGAPFNIGEVTVTRCAVRLDSGEVGFGNVLGRDAARAELVARFDALLQTDRYRDLVETLVLQPVAERIRNDDERVRRKVAATRVNFFTMVRGEDE